MKPECLAVALVAMASGAARSPAVAQQPSAAAPITRTELLRRTLPPGDFRDVQSAIIDLAPGASAPRHRHDVAVFAYVLEGTVENQFDGAAVLTHRTGDSWWEQPGTVHDVARNASRSARARLLIVYVGEPGTPTTVSLSAAAPTAPGTLHALDRPDGLRLENVDARAVTHEGRAALRITASEAGLRRVTGLPIAQQSQVEWLAVLAGTDFSSGTIEAEVAGSVAPGAPEGARGFVGVAFRVQPDLRTYDAFYLRPTNGRAEDQVRRNHSAQYISHPEYTWQRFRREAPERYESYVDLEPGAWTRIRIEVRGDTARLFVHDQKQPTLIVSDLRTGARARGAIALWINPGTVGHFRNLRVTP